ncbi:MAG TPA: ISAzo13 family transposase, partial [Pirellulales bacterium]|nr:ISAzo13 family transposase [Pirellulales bacterium]
HRLAEDLGMSIRVAHYPPGCSKYNPIEHRMFCQVTRAMEGVVLESVDIAKQFIGRATTSTGLRVIAKQARSTYSKGIPATADFLARMPIRFHHFLPVLNYTAPLTAR